jgi:hypothetical protein
MATQTHDVLFTGGVPGDTVEEVFRTLAGFVGSRALAYPDGEIGERTSWIGALNQTTWPHVDGLEEIPTPLPADHPFGSHRTFVIADGVKSLDLRGKLPYARGAIASYEVFKSLREQGVVAPDVRFQVSIPAAHDAVCLYLPRVEDWPQAFDGWVRAVQDDCRRMLEIIPADDLVIQIDFCTELVEMAGVLAQILDWVDDAPTEELLEKYTAESYVAPHFAAVPDETLVGFHICAGTYPRQPTADLKDISLPVAIANALVANAGRRVDYVHLPAMRDRDAEYFRPLSDLDIGDTTVYLGVECNDGIDLMQRRIDSARRYLDTFGVAHYCGYLWNREILPKLLSDLATGADHNAATAQGHSPSHHREG